MGAKVGLIAFLAILWFPAAYGVFVPALALARLALADAPAVAVAVAIGVTAGTALMVSMGRVLLRQLQG